MMSSSFAASQVAASGAVILLDYKEEDLGKTIASSKKSYLWRLLMHGKEFEIQFLNTKMTGKKRVKVNGFLQHEQQQFTSSRFMYNWPLSQHFLCILPNNEYKQILKAAFVLTIDGVPFFEYATTPLSGLSFTFTRITVDRVPAQRDYYGNTPFWGSSSSADAPPPPRAQLEHDDANFPTPPPDLWYNPPDPAAPVPAITNAPGDRVRVGSGAAAAVPPSQQSLAGGTAGRAASSSSSRALVPVSTGSSGNMTAIVPRTPPREQVQQRYSNQRQQLAVVDQSKSLFERGRQPQSSETSSEEEEEDSSAQSDDNERPKAILSPQQQAATGGSQPQQRGVAPPTGVGMSQRAQQLRAQYGYNEGAGQRQSQVQVTPSALQAGGAVSPPIPLPGGPAGGGVYAGATGQPQLQLAAQQEQQQQLLQQQQIMAAAAAQSMRQQLSPMQQQNAHMARSPVQGHLSPQPPLQQVRGDMSPGTMSLSPQQQPAQMQMQPQYPPAQMQPGYPHQQMPPQMPPSPVQQHVSPLPQHLSPAPVPMPGPGYPPPGVGPYVGGAPVGASYGQQPAYGGAVASPVNAGSYSAQPRRDVNPFSS